MLDLTHIFINAALAQTTAPAAPVAASSQMSSLMNYAPLALIMVMFYFLILRPQQKKMAEQEKMIKALKRGDRVIVGGGIYGKITKLEGETLTIEIADNVNIKVVRAQVQTLSAKPDTTLIANDADNEVKK